MFTGIIEEVGRVNRFEKRGLGGFITIEAEKVTSGLSEGDSVCVDGTCLTATAVKGNLFSAEVSHETAKKSIIGSYRTGSIVNLERPVSPGGFMGGHFVQGHIDTTVRIVSIRKVGDHTDLEIELPAEYTGYVVSKGSIALNGVSLTVSEKKGHRASVSLIPATLKNTILGKCRRGDQLNLEVDIIGKYIKSFVDVYVS
jgi:riboflavin synthase